MIQLTQKGKEIYGDRKLTLDGRTLGYYIESSMQGYAGYTKSIAEGIVEIKALLDIGLIEIK